jgi:hypothetical protein
VCARATALDGVKAGFETHLIEAGTRPVSRDQGSRSIAEMKEARRPTLGCGLSQPPRHGKNGLLARRSKSASKNEGSPVATTTCGFAPGRGARTRGHSGGAPVLVAGGSELNSSGTRTCDSVVAGERLGVTLQGERGSLETCPRGSNHLDDHDQGSPRCGAA